VEPSRFLEEARSLKAVLDGHVKDDDGAGVEGFMATGVDGATRNR
jgi:hypothetical protein